jgi:hypothetical protein
MQEHHRAAVASLEVMYLEAEYGRVLFDDRMGLGRCRGSQAEKQAALVVSLEIIA